MVRHTLKARGRGVLSTRMLRDYVDQLYLPAARASATRCDPSRASEFAAWKRRVRDGWDAVRIEHVESHGVADSPQIGSRLEVAAFVSLGELTGDDVAVELVHGRIGPDDELIDPRTLPLGEIGRAHV